MTMYNFKPEEIIIGVFPASPKKGMLTGKNAVGVKVTHIPTGLSVIYDKERSQHKNREMALILLWGLVQNKPSKLECAEAEIEALKAQVESLRDAGSALRERWNLDNILGANTRALVLAWDVAVSKTPEQCLADHDREVAARAAKAAFVAGFTYCYEQDCEPLAGLAESANYANKIKSGEVEICQNSKY